MRVLIRQSAGRTHEEVPRTAVDRAIDVSAEELDSGFPTFPAPSSTLDPNPFFGRVVYAGGLAIDQPLSVTRYDYKDNPGTSLTWPRFTLFPLWDHRGTPVVGLFSDSAQYKPYAKGPTQTACPPPGDNTPQRCVYVTWPFAGDPYDKAKGGLLTLSWLGSQLQTRRDGSGLEYLRNRLYDPKTGRFTQEDRSGWRGGSTPTGTRAGIRSTSRIRSGFMLTR